MLSSTVLPGHQSQMPLSISHVSCVCPPFVAGPSRCRSTSGWDQFPLWLAVRPSCNCSKCTVIQNWSPRRGLLRRDTGPSKSTCYLEQVWSHFGESSPGGWMGRTDPQGILGQSTWCWLGWQRVIEVVSASACPARWEESLGEKKLHLPVLLIPKKVPPDPYPSGTQPSQWIFSYDLAVFQATTSSLGLRNNEFVWELFKRRVSIFHSLLDFPDISPAGFQSQMSCGSSTHAGPAGWGAFHGVQGPHSSRGTSVVGTVLPTVGYHTGCVGSS